MNIAIFGLSGASNALGKALADSKNVTNVYDFFSTQGKSNNYIPMGIESDNCHGHVKNFIESSSIDLIIPTSLELQLSNWFGEAVRKKNIPCLLSDCDQPGIIEWSKALSKEIILEAGIPTPEFKIITLIELINDFLNIPRPFVIKYDMHFNFGLQTYIVKEDNYLGYYNSLRSLTNYNPEKKVIIENYIDGAREISYHVLCNEVNWQYFGSARDYKKRYDNDQGHNTIGMGAYSPVAPYDSLIHSYVDKLLITLKKRNTPYIGILYLGIMISKTGIPYLLEINTRPGDPETQTFLPLIKNDLTEILLNTATNNYIPKIEFSDKSSVSVVVTSEDYKNISTKNNIINLDDINDNITISRHNVKNMVHSVLTSVDIDVNRASDNIYDYLNQKNLKGYYYRKDIGYFK